MKVEVLTKDGQKSGRQVELADAIFSIEPNDHCIYLTVKQYLANQRQGTHSSLEKSEVSGSTRKLHKQKGTGGSRKGSIKNPLYKGGGRIFGPKPRDYSFKLNKKVKDLARRSALTYKAKANEIVVVENFELADNKTKSYVQILKNLGLDKSKTLMVLPSSNRNIELAGRNLPKAKTLTASKLNTYEVLNAKNLIFMEGALANIPTIQN